VVELLAARIEVLDAPHVKALEVTIEESPGQGASCRLPLR